MDRVATLPKTMDGYLVYCASQLLAVSLARLSVLAFRHRTLVAEMVAHLCRQCRKGSESVMCALQPLWFELLNITEVDYWSIGYPYLGASKEITGRDHSGAKP